MNSTVAVNNADAYAARCGARFGLVQLPISVLYPHQRQLSPRVRVFVDWLASLFEVMPI